MWCVNVCKSLRIIGIEIYLRLAVMNHVNITEAMKGMCNENI